MAEPGQNPNKEPQPAQQSQQNSLFQYRGLQHVFKKEARCLHTRDAYLMAASYDATAVIWKYDEKTQIYNEVATLTHQTGLLFSVHIAKTDGGYLFAYGGNDKNIYICNEKGELVKTIQPAHENQV